MCVLAPIRSFARFFFHMCMFSNFLTTISEGRRVVCLCLCVCCVCGLVFGAREKKKKRERRTYMWNRCVCEGEKDERCSGSSSSNNDNKGRKVEGNQAHGVPLFSFSCVCLLLFLGSRRQRAGALAGARLIERGGQEVVACLPSPA